MNLLLDNSITIVFLVTVYILARSEYKRYLAKKLITPEQFRSRASRKLQDTTSGLLLKLVNALLITVVISIVSFRELWVNDVFHIVFLTLLMARPLHRQLKGLFE